MELRRAVTSQSGRRTSAISQVFVWEMSARLLSPKSKHGVEHSAGWASNPLSIVALRKRFCDGSARSNLFRAFIHFADLCNSISIAFAVPVAAFDLNRISGDLEVRRADGSETYETFAGEIEHPDPGEIIFADSSGRAHARRWTNRQSGHSAVGNETASVLVVSEAMHETAAEDVSRIAAVIKTTVMETWPLASVVELRSG